MASISASSLSSSDSSTMSSTRSIRKQKRNSTSSSRGWFSSIFHSIVGSGSGNTSSSSTSSSSSSSSLSSLSVPARRSASARIKSSGSRHGKASAEDDQPVSRSQSVSSPPRRSGALAVPLSSSPRSTIVTSVDPTTPVSTSNPRKQQVSPPSPPVSPRNHNHDRPRNPEPTTPTAVAPARRQKGVKWDEKVMSPPTMKQSTKGRYADVYVAPPYSNVASPVDWRIPPIAVYPHMSRYRLIGQMGEGAFSTVYRAIDTKTSHLVALKLVSKSHLNATQHTNVLREASLLRRINHPNVTRLLDFQETPTHYALSLELMTAGEIFHRLVSRVSFSEDVCRHVTVQVAEGLRYLHEEIGVVHRDIKLENLLFESIPAHLLPKDDEDAFLPGVGGAGIGVVKIADFGLSKIVFSSTTKTPCGTVGYTAPEILAARPRYNKGVDMWALGCVLYTLLSGFPPFFDDDPRGLTDKVANGQYAFLSPWFDDISVEAKDLVAGLLVVDPEKRLTIQQVLRHPWMRATVVAPPSVTINEPTVAEPQPTAAPPVRPITPPPQDDWQHISELRDQKCLRTPLESDFRSPLHHMALRTPQASEDRDPGHEHGSSVAPAHPDSAHPSPDYYFVTPPAPLTNNPAPAGPIAALLPLRTPRTPHPVPEGMLTKAVLDAPYQAYKHMAEGKTGNVPEHVGTVRGGIVPRGIVGPSGGGVGNRTNDVPPSDGGRRKGAFELKMDNTSRLLEERRRRAAVVPT